ncbi:MAG: phosphoglycerate kinase [Synergistales bacterium]|nr:phosphoglycerate kinase [Synergistales bacterium]
MTPLQGMDVRGKQVLLRLDINSPVNVKDKRIANDNRIQKSLPTLRYLLENGARTAIISHQGDTLDYQNLIPLEEHARILSRLLGTKVVYIDDVCGPAAREMVQGLKDGEMVLLGNLRYLGEELSTFEKDVKLKPEEMLGTWLIRSLAPLFHLYVNDAFSAAHRNAPSMTAFQEILPTAAGFLLFDEFKVLHSVLHGATKPCVFVLGGAKISDAFGMMETVLKNGTADGILTTGVTGLVMLLASGVDVGERTVEFFKDKDLMVFVDEARKYLNEYPGKFEMPVDVAYEKEGKRMEMDVDQMPIDGLYPDIGERTIKKYAERLSAAGTIFANGPAGMYENPLFEKGTRGVWEAIAESSAFSVIGGGDTVSSATQFIDLSRISYVCTGGGAMIRFMSGKKLPLIEAMQKAYDRVEGKNGL